MRLNKKIAQSIAQSASDVIGRDVLVTDESGTIIGSNETRRVGQMHEPSIEVVARRAAVTTTPEEAARMQGVKPGYTLPIEMSNRPIGTISIAGSPAKVRRYGQLVQKQAEIMLKEQAFLEISIRREQALRDLAESLLLYDPVQTDEEALVLRAQDLGYDIGRCTVAVILEIAGGEEKINQALRQAQHFFGAENAVSPLRNAQIAVLLTEGESHAEERCQELIAMLGASGIPARAGVGTKAHDIASLALSAKTAREALSAREARFGEGRVFVAEKLRIEMLLASLPASRKRAFASDVAKGIANADPGGELMRTFEVWCASPFSPSEAARKLSIHRNTLQYRLKKIKEIAGLDPWNFRDAFELWAALLLRDENIRKAR